MGGKTEENVVYMVGSTESSELGLQGEHAFQKVQEAMFSDCTIHNIDFREPVEAHELFRGALLQKR